MSKGGDAVDRNLLVLIDEALFCTHLVLEIMYIYFGCTPMIYINIASILSYVVGVFIIRKGHEFDYNGTVIPVTVSIGAAEYEDTMTPEKLVQAADARLYEAKETGRNRVIC